MHFRHIRRNNIKILIIRDFRPILYNDLYNNNKVCFQNVQQAALAHSALNTGTAIAKAQMAVIEQQVIAAVHLVKMAGLGHHTVIPVMLTILISNACFLVGLM